MNAYIYAADLWCEGCGRKLRDEIPLPRGADTDDESTYDSEFWPKGPYPDGGGEADSPQHCAAGADCVDAITLATGDRIGAWLENDLTPEGVEYVVEAIQEAREDSADTPHARYRRAVTALWAEWYADVLPATPETVRQFIARTGLHMTCEPATGNPNMDADAWGATARHWRCVLHFGRRRLTVPFSQGSAHTDSPTVEDVLECLASDARGYEDDDVFGDWAVAREYDSDSRHAERIFLAVARQSAKLRRFLGPAEYDALTRNGGMIQWQRTTVHPLTVPRAGATTGHTRHDIRTGSNVSDRVGA